MTDRDYAPLTAVCVRTLSDKVYEKRKAAAFEIEKMTRECVSINNHTQIKRVVKLLSTDFVSSHNPNMRKGALVGLAAVAIALGPEISDYTNDLVRPILTCMADTDARVRYYACESLYNIAKVAREQILPLFNDVFAAMSVAIADADLSVRTGTELLVKLSMNIITEQPSFPVETLIPVLKERMYKKNVFTRLFHLEWISTLKHVPDSKLLFYLPEILDQLFIILSDDKKDVRSRCDRIMVEFLDEIRATVNESKANGDEEVAIAFSEMINILVLHAQSDHVDLQIMAAQWILEFIRLSKFQMLPHVSGILMALLPNLVFDDERRRNMSEKQYKRIRELSNLVNVDLMKLVRSAEKWYQRSLESESEDFPPLFPGTHLELEPLVEVLTKQLQRGRVETKLAVLRWIYHLFKICQQKMIKLVDEISPVLLNALSDTSDEVVFVNLQVLAEICSPENVPAKLTSGEVENTNPHFKLFLLSLLKQFSSNKTLLEIKGSFIIRQLCVLLSAEDIYRNFADLLITETNLKFARHMVETLNTILLTTSELLGLRNLLRQVGSSKESCDLFLTLYKTWCHSQIAAVALCFLTGCYGHAGDLVKVVSEQEINLEMLKELDRFMQLLESPIFTHMRMELLDLKTNSDLLRALQSLLMILPQSEAYFTLRDRLNCLQKVRELSDGKEHATAPKSVPDFDFVDLLNHYKTVQRRHMDEEIDHKQNYQLTDGVRLLELSDDKEID